MKTYQIDTLEQAFKLSTNQLTVADLFNGDVLTKDNGWVNVILTDKLRDEVATIVSEILGGRHKTRAQVKRTLLFCNGNIHWSLERMIVTDYNNKYGISYCAGQDYSWECAQARKALR